MALAEKLRPDLTVIGPELPLVSGLSDALRARNLAVVGPSQIAAQLEGSKIFSKQFLARHAIPTAKLYGEFAIPDEAYSALADVPYPVVVKADGLCAGKGVLLAQSESEARDFVTRAMLIQEFGVGGKRVMLEEMLEGDELSFIIVTDGDNYAVLAPTRDHKRAFDGNRGPNTGGMGAYSTDDLVSPELQETIATNDRGALFARIGRRRHPLSGISFHWRDAHQRRAQGIGVQLPVRRPGNAGDSGASGF